MVRLKTAPVRSLEVKLELNDNFKCTLDPASVTNIAAVSKEEDLLARRAVPNFPTGSAPKYDRQFLHFSSPFIPSQAGQLPGSQPQPSSFSPGYSFTSPGSNYSHSHSSSALSPLPELNGGGSYELSSKRESTFASPSSSEITPKSSSSSSSSASLTVSLALLSFPPHSPLACCDAVLTIKEKKKSRGQDLQHQRTEKRKKRHRLSIL